MKVISRICQVVPVLLASLPMCAQVSAEVSDSRSRPKMYTPIYLLSEKVGDVALEALGEGIPVLTRTQPPPIGAVYYADIDSVVGNRAHEVFAIVRERVLAGDTVILESSQFNFDRLRSTLTKELPAVALPEHMDVAVRIERVGVQYRATPVDPQQMASAAGVSIGQQPLTQSSGAATDSVSQAGGVTVEPPRPDWARPLNENSPKSYNGTVSRYFLPFAKAAYETAPSVANHYMSYNGTYVDLWKFTSNPKYCVVAWRGTKIPNLYDVYADLRSQVSYAPQAFDNGSGLPFKGGAGFVNRLHAYDQTVNGLLTSCTYIAVTGHSLGGAVAQLHAIQLVFSPIGGQKLRTLVAFNSPRVVDNYTQALYPGLVASGYQWIVNCRNHDWLVNPLPTGLFRVGPQNSPTIAGCTYVGAGRPSALPTTNHNIDLWDNE